jgi:hypothetical protein
LQRAITYEKEIALKGLQYLYGRIQEGPYILPEQRGEAVGQALVPEVIHEEDDAIPGYAIEG